MPARDRTKSGFTLLELVVVIAIIGGLLVALTNIQMFALERSNDTQDHEERLALAHSALNEMQQAVRYSTELHGASSNILKVSTQYVVDDDDDIETIRYMLVNNEIIREVIDGTTTQELVLSNVDSFRAYTMEIRDGFTADDYSGVVNSFVAAPVDTANVVRYRVIDVIDIGSDFADAYDSDNERIALWTGLTTKSLELTPALSKQGLTAQVEFMPNWEGKEYQVLRYGNSSASSGSVAVVFKSDSTIAIQRRESGAIVAESASADPWAELASYTISLAFRDGVAWGVVTSEGVSKRIGVVGWGSMDDEPLEIETTGTFTTGFWDDLFVSYPEVKFELNYDVNGEAETLVGGATRRFDD